MQLWDLATKAVILDVDLEPTKGSYVYSVVFSPDGKTLASANGCIKLWDVATGKQRAVLRGHTRDAYSVVYSPDGKILASGSQDATIKLWDVDRGEERATLKGHTQGVNCVAFSPDGKLLASGGQDNRIILWEMPDAK